MDDLARRPRWTYTDSISPVDYHARLPQRVWTAGVSTVGGTDVSGAGVPAAFLIRRDHPWRLTLRFWESEWPSVERLVAHLQSGGSATFYPDRLSAESHTVYGVSPAMGEDVSPRISDEPAVRELDIVIRPTTSTTVRRTYHGRALWRFRAGDDPRHITFTRTGSIGARRNYEGVQEQLAANRLRTNWRMVNGVWREYTRLEAPRTNLFLRSQELDNAAWSKSEATVVANAGVGGDGTTTADRLVPSTNSTPHHATQSVTATADVTYALSVEVQASGYGFAALMLYENGDTGNRAYAVFDLADGGVEATNQNGTGAFVAAAAEDLGGGRWKLMLVGSVGDGATAIVGRLTVLQTGAQTPFTNWAGDGTSGVLFWGMQVENNVREASSYIPTTTAAASRGAEAFSDAFPFTPAQLAAMGGATFYLDFIEGMVPNFADEGGISTRLIQVGTTGVGNPRVELHRVGGADTYRMLHNNGAGTQVTSTADVNPARRNRTQLAGQFAPSGAVTLLARKSGTTDASGSASGASTPGAAWSSANIRLGGAVAGRGIQDYRDAVVFPGLLDIDECEREARAS
jgi:hypothetical protein